VDPVDGAVEIQKDLKLKKDENCLRHWSFNQPREGQLQWAALFVSIDIPNLKI